MVDLSEPNIRLIPPSLHQLVFNISNIQILTDRLAFKYTFDNLLSADLKL